MAKQRGRSIFEARWYFKCRTILNGLLVILVFSFGVWFFAPFTNAWLFEVGLIGILYFVFFNVLQKQTLPIHCPHCHRIVGTNTPWQCGVCGAGNLDTVEFPFINRCAKCGSEPKAYRCHHCQEIIFLTEDEVEAHIATCLKGGNSVSMQEAESNRLSARREMEHQLSMAELDEKLAQFKKRREMSTPKNPREAMKEQFEREYSEHMLAEEFAVEQKQQADLKFKDDDYFREKAHEFINDWLARRVK